MIHKLLRINLLIIPSNKFEENIFIIILKIIFWDDKIKRTIEEDYFRHFVEDKIEDKIRKHGDEEMNNDKWRTFILGEMKILPSLVMYTKL